MISTATSIVTLWFFLAFVAVMVDLCWLRPHSVRLETRLMFAPYDLWVGVFVSVEKRRVYILPLPCFGVVVSVVPR